MGKHEIIKHKLRKHQIFTYLFYDRNHPKCKNYNFVQHFYIFEPWPRHFFKGFPYGYVDYNFAPVKPLLSYLPVWVTVSYIRLRFFCYRVWRKKVFEKNFNNKVL